MERIVVTARFRPERAADVRALLDAGPPYEPAATELDRHAVYLSGRSVVFVFEGAGADEPEGLEDVVDAARGAVAQWHELLEEEPEIGRPVFVWERGSAPTTSPAAAALCAADVMDASCVRVAPEDTLAEVVEKMVTRDESPALVSDFGRLIGILSPHDVLRAVADRVHPSEGRAREWMSPVVATAPPGLPLDETAARMVAHGLHHLPVVDGERPMGVVALGDVVAGRARQPV